MIHDPHARQRIQPAGTGQDVAGPGQVRGVELGGDDLLVPEGAEFHRGNFAAESVGVHNVGKLHAAMQRFAGDAAGGEFVGHVSSLGVVPSRDTLSKAPRFRALDLGGERQQDPSARWWQPSGRGGDAG